MGNAGCGRRREKMRNRRRRRKEEKAVEEERAGILISYRDCECMKHWRMRRGMRRMHFRSSGVGERKRSINGAVLLSG